jgi:hypothetical protein
MADYSGFGYMARTMQPNQALHGLKRLYSGLLELLTGSALVKNCLPLAAYNGWPRNGTLWWRHIFKPCVGKYACGRHGITSLILTTEKSLHKVLHLPHLNKSGETQRGLHHYGSMYPAYG